ncbi:MAG TPA: carboxypeptidase regulatory-like domain-containing protein, partial [Verrucomicrobiae bacterium]|nr:carboxypeptidase regulatory-like domain-containing protein [Verrucomicrobiae bacterium]
MRRLVAVLVAGACFALPPPARAGTTGGLNGTVAERGTGAPIAGARVTATSPSQLAVALTDARGHFSFVSLAPDEYTISVSKPGFDSASYPGIAVFADAQQTLSLTLRKTLHTIASVSSRNASDLVRPGTTADITSIDGAQQARASALGGGGDLDSAYSAIASVPGAFVPANQSGYLQAVHVRGGDADQVGYELDGVPVNRAFDNYPSGSLSSLGQLELQVYTGATPAGAEAQGLAGFVNQVLKTGTFPGYATIAPAIGGPTFYHRFDVEAGGSTPDRLFSYYVGIGGFDQEHRYGDQFNGAAVADEFGSILNACPAPAQLPPPGSLAEMPPSCFTGGRLNTGIDGKPGYVLGPISFAGATPDGVDSRTTVVNLHVGIPHGRDSGHDDVQLLYDDDTIFTALLSSPNDEGLLNFNGTAYQPGRLPYYLDAYRYRGPLGAMLPANYASLVDPYFFPSSPGDRAFDAPIPLDQRDVGYNDQGIVKLQYQRNYGSAAYLRVYGYSYYSDYITTGPDSSWQPYTGYFSGDYELNSHTRGASATFADQLDSEHLLEIEGSYTTSTTLRMFNEQMFQSSGEFGDAFAVLVNPRAIGTGTCYALPTDAQGAYQAGGAAVATSCNDGVSIPISAGATFASLYQTGRSGTLVSTTGAVLPRSLAAYTCGGGPCSFFVDENGSYGQYNDVRPAFYGFS